MGWTIKEFEADFYAKVDRGEITLSPAGHAKRARDAKWRRLAHADADTLILELGVKDMHGPDWDALRSDIRVAAAITGDGPERSRAWNRFYTPARDPADKEAGPHDFFSLTKRRPFLLYFRSPDAPTEPDVAVD
jgi:hypothetical protein